MLLDHPKSFFYSLESYSNPPYSNRFRLDSLSLSFFLFLLDQPDSCSGFTWLVRLLRKWQSITVPICLLSQRTPPENLRAFSCGYINRCDCSRVPYYGNISAEEGWLRSWPPKTDEKSTAKGKFLWRELSVLQRCSFTRCLQHLLLLHLLHSIFF